eukprot:COSAG01_NODE_2398_length_7765_cov_29.002087_4_plen_141_part_00
MRPQLLLHDLYRRVLVCGIISGYATFCALAGVDKTDTRAALAKLPPVDGLDLWPYLTGASKSSPRTEVFADSQPFGVLLMEIGSTKWKLYMKDGPDEENTYNSDMEALAPFWYGTPPPKYDGSVGVGERAVASFLAGRFD